MDYRDKYLKYKKKYLLLKEGGNFDLLEQKIKSKEITNLGLSMFHGQLLYNEQFTIPKNIYLLQAKVCGLTSYMNDYSSFFNTVDDKFSD